MAGNFQKTITHNELFEHFSIKNYNTKKTTPKLKIYMLKILYEQILVILHHQYIFFG